MLVLDTEHCILAILAGSPNDPSWHCFTTQPVGTCNLLGCISVCRLEETSTAGGISLLFKWGSLMEQAER